MSEGSMRVFYDGWLDSDQGQKDWDEAYARFPRFNDCGADTDGAMDFLIERCVEYWAAKPSGKRISQKIYDELCDCIHAGLT